MRAPYFVSFLWGLSEATFFFIVPDVWLTILALESGGKKLLRAVGWAVFGALIGGLLIYGMAGYFQSGIYSFFDHIPGIQVKLIEGARQSIAQHGWLAFPVGIFQGIPYKILSTEWRLSGENLSLFISMSIIARAGRFLFAAGVTRWICGVFEERIQNWKTVRIFVLLGFWIIFYIFYFYYNGW